MASTYLTVAIPYVNAAPHVGYAYELVLADIAARARRARPGTRVRLLGGTDDYSLKNVLAAEAAGVPTDEFVAGHAARFAGLGAPLSIGFDDFIHTGSDPRHAPAVARLWGRVADRGDLYRRRYAGRYCVGCEQFYAPAELVAGRCPEHGVPTETVEEENWFFRLSAYQDHLEAAITSGALRITPRPFREEALAFVRAGLDDISVSRSSGRARGWGVPVPGDTGQVVYVWFDALANYLSALGYGDPGSPDYGCWWAGADERIHVIGKGILRFHAVYWPAFLASAGEPGPTRIHVHPYLSIGGAKLSKSSGSGLDPVDLVARYGVDALRWWCACDVSAVADTDFSEERLVARANEDLAGGFANVVSRITALVHRHFGGALPDGPAAPLAALEHLADNVHDALADFDLRRGTRLLIEAVAALNRHLEDTAPWALAKKPGRGGELERLLRCHLTSAAEVARALSPVLPNLAGRLERQLGRPGRPLVRPEPTYRWLPAAGGDGYRAATPERDRSESNSA